AGHAYRLRGRLHSLRTNRKRIRNEIPHHAVSRAADTDAARPVGAGPVHAARFGVRDINIVVLVDVYPARPAELIPGVEQFHVLIEDLDPVVAAVADEKTPL